MRKSSLHINISSLSPFPSLSRQVSNEFLLVIVFLIRGGVTIHSSSPRWRLFGVDIVECIGSSTRYTPNSRNKYTFTALTFLEALKLRDKIWNSTATVAPTLKSSTSCPRSGKSLLIFANSQTSYVNGKISWKYMVLTTSRAFLLSEMSSMSSYTLSDLVEKLTTDSILAGFQYFSRFPHFFNMRRRFYRSLPVKQSLIM